MFVAPNKVVALSYQLSVSDSNTPTPTFFESAPSDQPMAFIYQMQEMLPLFEEAIANKQKGDTFEVTIPAENGYGEYSLENVVGIPKDNFLVDGNFDAENIKAGEWIPMMNDDEDYLDALVKEVKEDEVILDFNHVLAGKTLHFSGTIELVREATEQELEHGHIHGLDGTEMHEEETEDILLQN